uniref:DEK_C domain-containing protein n=1 Tax=Strongyloides venezuelensis TaxID=75913 RepID=A0A0K0FGM1_STRVS
MSFTSGEESPISNDYGSFPDLMTMDQFLDVVKNIVNGIKDNENRTIMRVLKIIRLQKSCSEREIKRIVGGNFADFLNGEIGRKHFNLSTRNDGSVIVSTVNSNSFKNDTNTRFSFFGHSQNNTDENEGSSFVPVFATQQIKHKYYKTKGKLMLSVVSLLSPMSTIPLTGFNINFALFTKISLDAKFRQQFFGPGPLAKIIKQNFENNLELKVIDCESFITSNVDKSQLLDYCEKLANEYHEISGKEKIGLSRVKSIYCLLSTTTVDRETWIPAGVTFSTMFD